ncbi:MAG: hypothetical protein II747_03330 [Clostridia bacterium]|nr:hypothetical protein [Clostridia bacterium]
MKHFFAIIAIALVFSMLFMLACSVESRKYTDADFEKMSAQELYKVLKDNGLTVDDEIMRIWGEEKMAELIKHDFELFKQGYTSLEYDAYHELAESIQGIYDRIKQ